MADFVYKIWNKDTKEYFVGGTSRAKGKKFWNSAGAARNAVAQGSAIKLKNYEVHKFELAFKEKV